MHCPRPVTPYERPATATSRSAPPFTPVSTPFTPAPALAPAPAHEPFSEASHGGGWETMPALNARLRPRTLTTGLQPLRPHAPRTWPAAASPTDRPRPRRRSICLRPPRCSYQRPDFLLPHVRRVVVTLDGATVRLLPGPAVPLQQPTRSLVRVPHVEQFGRSASSREPGSTADHPGRGSQRAALRLPFQLDDPLFAEPRTPGGALRPDSRLAVLASRADPSLHRQLADSLHRPPADSQRGSYLPFRLPAVPGFNALQPDRLPRGPLSIGQPAFARVSHVPGLELSGCRRANGAATSPNQVR